MQDLKVLTNFVRHEKIFNVIFWIIMLLVVSFPFCFVMAYYEIAINGVIWACVMAALVFVISAFGLLSPEVEVAYYRTWCDYFHGLGGQRQLVLDYADFYDLEVSDLKTRKVQVANEGTFRVEPIYAKRIAQERNLLLGRLRQEYIEKNKIVKENVLRKQIMVERAEETSTAFVERLEKLRKTDQDNDLASEIFVKRQEEQKILEQLRKARQVHKNAKYELTTARLAEDELTEVYQNSVEIVMEYYNTRYTKFLKKVLQQLKKLPHTRFEVIEDLAEFSDAASFVLQEEVAG